VKKWWIDERRDSCGEQTPLHARTVTNVRRSPYLRTRGRDGAVLALPDADGVAAWNLAVPPLQAEARLLRRGSADALRRPGRAPGDRDLSASATAGDLTSTSSGDSRGHPDPALHLDRVPNGRLTRRELDVLRLLAEGLQHEEIGRRLGIRSETVCTHLRKASGRLGATTRTQAVATALRRGLIA
jgi:DNA-binding CsgD family transcriptional regulator